MANRKKLESLSGPSAAPMIGSGDKSTNEKEAIRQHLDALWDESNVSEWIIKLRAEDSFASIIKNTRISREIARKSIIVCADGRCQHPGEEISAAGSGILMDQASLEKMIKESGARTITSHAECGAAKIAYEAAKAAGRLPDGIENAEDYAQHWSFKTARKYGLMHEHLDRSTFNDAHHHERGLIIDTTKRFHPTMFRGMPNMFVDNSPSYAEADYTESIISALSKIALGDHGFGGRFSSEFPFYVLLAVRNEKEKNELVEIAQRAISQFGNRVVVKAAVVE